MPSHYAPISCVHLSYADIWVLPSAKGIHRLESHATETRAASSVVAEGHAHHPCHLQSQELGSYSSARYVYVLHHRQEPGVWRDQKPLVLPCIVTSVMGSFCLSHVAPPWSKVSALQPDDTQESSRVWEDKTQPRIQDMQNLSGTLKHFALYF